MVKAWAPLRVPQLGTPSLPAQLPFTMRDRPDFLLEPYPRAEKSAEPIACPGTVLISSGGEPGKPGWRSPSPDSGWTTAEAVTEALEINNINTLWGQGWARVSSKS